jgi:hypothetical protein
VSLRLGITYLTLDLTPFPFLELLELSCRCSSYYWRVMWLLRARGRNLLHPLRH